MANDQLSPARMEAFSDGVIAVIITIMVLELRVPPHESSNIQGLRAVLPVLLVYLLSFVQTGIYWVNHHYLLDDVETISHGMLWSNLALLFSLSLIPFATRWVGERGISSFSISLYSVTCFLPAVSWTVLSSIIARRSETPTVGTPVKQAASTLLYLGAIPAAYISPYLALAMIVIVAGLWLVSPRKSVMSPGRVAEPRASRAQTR